MSAFGDTMTINVGALSKVLTKINGPNNYASEYLLKESTQQFRARVRHTQTGGKAGAPLYDRHNVEIVQTIYATETVAEFSRKVYIVIEQLPTDENIELADALADFCIANTGEALDELNEWKS